MSSQEREASRENSLTDQLRIEIARHRADAATRLGQGAMLPDLAPGCRLDEPELPARRSLPARAARRLRQIAFRLLARWYVRPMVAQQLGFNRAAARRLRELLDREEALRDRIEALEQQVDALERGKR